MSGGNFPEVDLDLLADYLGGALSGPDEEQVARRIADDPAWRAAHETLAEQLDSVTAVLHSLGPVSMPDDVAARLDAALRAEGAAPPVPVKVLDEARRAPAAAGRSRWRPRWAPIAVAAGLTVLAGYGVTTLADQAELTDSAGSATSEQVAAGPAAADASMVRPPAQDQIFASEDNYSTETLGTSAVRSFGKSADAMSGETAAAAGKAPLLLCLEAIAQENSGGPIAVLSVDYARFEGAPAVVVRFTAANGAWAWASGRDCGTPGAGAATLARVPVR